MLTLLGQFGISPDPGQLDKFSRYAEFLLEYNEKVNLTAITDPEGIAIKHFADSVIPLSLVPFPEGSTVIDVGTGAGFPGVPMKILRPDLSLTLLDSLQKRLTFLGELSERIGQPDNRLVHARAEAAGADPALRGKYDVAVSRAVARLAVLCEYCLPLVRVGGFLVALKGPDCQEELEEARNAIRILGGGEPRQIEYSLGEAGSRSLIIIPKLMPTAKKFPRQRVKINEKPL
ncbi:MAG: 16S rRNA (guanine(527)-N(7))-methyltransferase RsmG [Oscillospiraceae bacterium]|nr:MAG: 16S rRNA (guanine(527)-N(7))-methyltransferase RsmG [Oscillospiraceae bacterium]